MTNTQIATKERIPMTARLSQLSKRDTRSAVPVGGWGVQIREWNQSLRRWGAWFLPEARVVPSRREARDLAVEWRDDETQTRIVQLTAVMTLEPAK